MSIELDQGLNWTSVPPVSWNWNEIWEYCKLLVQLNGVDIHQMKNNEMQKNVWRQN